jgi:hypothetical protein
MNFKSEKDYENFFIDGVLRYIERCEEFPKHWSDYLAHEYEIFNHGVYGASNESIIYQLGYLPEYRSGDRIVIVFTDPNRMRKMSKNYSDRGINRVRDIDYVWSTQPSDLDEKTLHRLLVSRSESWDKGYRQDEIRFISLLKKLLYLYRPVFVSWSETFVNIEDVEFIDVRDYSIWIETNGEIKDAHMSAEGNLKFYQQIKNSLKSL